MSVSVSHSLMKVSEESLKCLNIVNILASANEPESCQIYLVTLAFTNMPRGT